MYPYGSAMGTPFNTPIGLSPGLLNPNTPLPLPAGMVGADVRPMFMVTGGQGCGYEQSPFWAPDANQQYSCGSCAFGVDTTKMMKYGRAGCGSQLGAASMCGQNPCELSMRSIDSAFEDISAQSHLSSLYMQDQLDLVTLSSTKGSYLQSLRDAPCPTGPGQSIYQGAIGNAALVAASRFWSGP